MPSKALFLLQSGEVAVLPLNGALNQRELQKEMTSQELRRGRMEHASAQLKKQHTPLMDSAPQRNSHGFSHLG